MRTLSTLFLLISFFGLRAQETWTYYNNAGMTAYSLFAEEDTLWLSLGSYGIGKLNIKTDKLEFFDHTNTVLPKKAISAITSDNAGNLWLASDSTVIRWNRKQTVTIWNTSNSSITPARFNGILYHQSSGVVWLSSFGGGVTNFNGQSWKNFTTSNSALVDNNTTNLKLDPQGNVWVNQRYKGIAKFTGSNWTVYNPGGNSLRDVNDFTFDGAGNIYTYKENDLKMFNGSTWTSLTGQSNNYYLSGESMEFNKTTGTLWSSTRYVGGAVTSYKNGQWTYYEESNSDIVNHNNRDLVVDKYGSVWFASDICLHKFDGSKWTRFNTSKSGLPDNGTSGFQFDANKTAWFFSQFGLSSLEGQKFTTWMKDANGEYLDTIRGIAIDSKGNKWVGRPNKLHRLNGNTWTVYNRSDFSVINSQRALLYCVATDKLDNVWIGNSHGVSKFDGSTWSYFDATNSALTGTIRQIETDSKGNVYALQDSIVFLYNGSNWTNITRNKGLTVNKEARVMHIDKNLGDLYLTSAQWPYSSYCKYNGSTWSCSDFPVQIFDLAVDKSNVWIATGSDIGTGVSKMVGPTRLTYTTANGLPSNQVNFISVDQSNRKWFSTWGGIAILDDNITTNLEEANLVNAGQKALLSPNPLSSATTLTWHTEEQVTSMELYSLLGELVLSQPCQNNQCELGGKVLPKGLYQAKGLSDSQKQVTLKLLVE